MRDDMQPPSYPELEQELEEIPVEQDAKPVSSQPNDWNVASLCSKYDRGLIELQPHYQREYVWERKPELPSRLIESILLKIPIPPIYFMQSADSTKIEVVDGQQRLTTLIRFVKNEFQLQKLQKLGSLNNLSFNQLSQKQQEDIRDATIRSIIIDSGTNHELRYEIFERLNRGTMPLNEQEIRNCAYRGAFCDLLSELESYEVWRKIKGSHKPEPRFVEREMILRFFAFVNRIDYYGGNLKKFLNDYMGKYAPQDPQSINHFKTLFQQTMNNVYTVFAENSAKNYTQDGWESKFSISALDIQSSALIGYTQTKVKSVSHEIREAYQDYMINAPDIQDALIKRPANTKATKARWFGFKLHVQEIISKP